MSYYRRGGIAGIGGRFKPSPAELTLQVAVASAGKGSAGVRWWYDQGGESREF
jgi:hypothetical protein